MSIHRCTVCLRDLAATFFYNSHIRDDVTLVCRPCRTARADSETRRCSHCDQVLPISAFSGTHAQCRPCLNRYRKTPQYYQKKRARRCGPWGLFNGAKVRAREKGLPFEITQDDIKIPDVCPLLGIPLIHGKTQRPTDNSPSLDRIDSSKGYTRDNVWVISFRANAIKRDASPEELMRLATALMARVA